MKDICQAAWAISILLWCVDRLHHINKYSAANVRLIDPSPLLAYSLPEPAPYYLSNIPAGTLLASAPWTTSHSYLPDYVPAYRTRPRGLLLGGSAPATKPSKLAALAAARKKKETEQKVATQTADKGHTSAVSLLDRLTRKESGAEETRKGNKPPTEVPAASTRTYALRRKRSPSPVQAPPASKAPEAKHLEKIPREEVDLRAMPSVFARTICYAPPRPFHIEQKLPDNTAHLSSFKITTATAAEIRCTNNDPFAGPSPDDVVLNAQAKGVMR